MTRPSSTYRLQLHAGFTFGDAAAIVDYLCQLGISHAYCSPYLAAVPGSAHGYDVVDHTQINPELGGADAHRGFTEALRRRGMGHLVDIVPNHMAAHPDNRWWWDVLKNGPSSPFARYFDIDWEAPDKRLRRRILLPVLGDHYGRVLERGELKIDTRREELVVRYFDHLFPVCGPAANSLEERGAMDASLDVLNSNPQALHALLEEQHYRLAYWRAGDRALNYRRFFDIKTLIALRMDYREVFDDVHHLVVEELRKENLDGVRVDHIDGLYDPQRYLEQLREAAGDAYIVVEKILEADEPLRTTWPVAGTTGYEFGALVTGLFIEPLNEAQLSEFYESFTAQDAPLRDIVLEKKLMIVRSVLASELDRLTGVFAEVCEAHLAYRDYTSWELREALAHSVAALPVYRTYVEPLSGRVHELDVGYVAVAVEAAKKNAPHLDPALFDFLSDVLLRRHVGAAEVELCIRFQQMTGPAMAKGLEDTVLYNYNRLVALNEVGADPGRFGTTVEEFHDQNERRQDFWPESMLATSTHDTKRSEDVRVRLALLSEIPERWTEAVTRWSWHHEKYRTLGMPDRNAEFLLYQTLVGAWPLPLDRAVAYMEKAAREAKAYTSWTDPDDAYEDALRGFVAAIVGDPAFTDDLARFVEPLLVPGWIGSLAQALLKLTSPGVPDVYQGTELWDLSLVDPDNRRPVDFDRRRELLAVVRDADAEQVWERVADGAPKLYLTQKALDLRDRRPDLFDARSSYAALGIVGDKSRHAIAYVRGGGTVTVVPRLVLSLAGDWADTSVELPSGSWINVLTGEDLAGGRTSLTELLRRFPVALLEKA